MVSHEGNREGPHQRARASASQAAIGGRPVGVAGERGRAPPRHRTHHSLQTRFRRKASTHKSRRPYANTGRRNHPSRKRGVRMTLPTNWIAGVASLDAERPPSSVRPEHWSAFVHSAKSFLDSWATKAAELG